MSMNDITKKGDITAAGGVVTIGAEGRKGVFAVVTGTWTATIVAEYSADDGATWEQTDFFDISEMRTKGSIAANGTYAIAYVGGGSVRLRASAFTSGTISVVLRATEAPSSTPGFENMDGSNVPGHGAQTGGKEGTTFRFHEVNQDKTVFASAAQTATVNSVDIANINARGARLHLDITAVSGTAPTLDVKLQAKVGGVYIDIAGAAFAQKTGTGTDELVVYPGVAETANESVSDVLPRIFRAVATIGGATPSFTFALTASLVL